MTKKEILVLSVVAVSAMILGAAYGDRIPLVKAVYPKLPGSRA
jgi:hypothetical protein